MRSKWFSVPGVVAAALIQVVSVGSCATGVPESEVAEVYYNLGNAYVELERMDAAATAYLRALQFDRTFTSASFNLARLYIETGRVPEGRRIVLDLLEVEPGNTVLLSSLAWAHYSEGDLEQALAIYEAILVQLPNDKDALYNAAVVAWRLDDHEEALKYFQSLNELEQRPEYLYEIGRLFASLDDPEQSIAYLEAYVEKRPNEPKAHLELGARYRELEDYSQALDAYDRALELSQNDPQALFARAEILLTAVQDQERGLAALRRAVSAGFRRSERLTEMARSLELPIRIEVVSFLRSQGLYADDESSESTGETTGEPSQGGAPAEP